MWQYSLGLIFQTSRAWYSGLGIPGLVFRSWSFRPWSFRTWFSRAWSSWTRSSSVNRSLRWLQNRILHRQKVFCKYIPIFVTSFLYPSCLVCFFDDQVENPLILFFFAFFFFFLFSVLVFNASENTFLLQRIANHL